ncbi:YdbL family protein, partial [Escherichia coli]|nr:YdbL family protein [Escherichia coli]NPK71653.1 YdbL family protein [Escherichia coli]NPS22461.1 YdbL family protein [Escherichia coli]
HRALSEHKTLSVSWSHYPETEKLVTDINAERKASYQQLAKQNNVSVDDIAKLAGQKLVERAKPGEYVQGINGKWVRKF